MRFTADLHIHSKYSRATSKDMTPEDLWKWSQLKGIQVIGTGDLTHPAWTAELAEKLEPGGNGLFSLRREYLSGDIPASCAASVSFLLSGEISCIYRKNGRTRKVHAVVTMPDVAAVERFNRRLAGIGNLQADGRPVLGLDAKELLRYALDASSEALFIPAHAWTPHFSVFGSGSGFDSLEECFEELTPYVPAIETGLSSDPPMNWRISALDRVTLVSSSDAHSPARIGREATVFDCERSYAAIAASVRTGRGILGTVEFFPEEGKYHHDGHRTCGVSMSPTETLRFGGRCPVCGGSLTVGVMHRIEALADREHGRRPPGAPGFTRTVPLVEIIAGTLRLGTASMRVSAAYRELIGRLGSELTILRETPLDDIARAGMPAVAEALGRMREGAVQIEPGYDGEYGKIRIDAGPEEAPPKVRAATGRKEPACGAASMRP